MKIPSIRDIDFENKKVIVRADIDVEVSEHGLGRLEVLLPTLELLAEKASKITIIGHRGRPEGEVNKEFSLEPVSQALEKMLIEKWGEGKVKSLDMVMAENLRFNKGEKENDEHFAEHLAEEGEVFINEAFATSHRKHASIVGLPKLMPSAAGLRFIEEVENLSKAFDNPQKPVLVLIGGVKKDKLDYLEDFKKFADKIVIAGRLPELMPEGVDDPKLFISKLIPDKEDITINSIERIEEEINQAGTIIVAGPMGKFEDEGHMMGTQKVFEAVVNSKAFKIAGGGDTLKAVTLLKLNNKFDWVSIGGGASLEFLAKRTLPGIEALLN